VVSAAEYPEEHGQPFGPLRGLRILDLSRYWAGPLAAQIMADMGAEVIKIEAPTAIDQWRLGGARSAIVEQTGAPRWECSPIFNSINRNKKEIGLSLSSDEGRDILRTLLKVSDALIENYTPRVMEKFGLDYENIRQGNPGLVYLSLPGFGGNGPWRDFVSFAYPTEEMTGFPSVTGYEDGPPMRWGNGGADSISGLFGAFALLTALHHKETTGEGQHIDLSQVEALTGMLGHPILDFTRHNAKWERIGNRHPSMVPHGVYLCSRIDEWVAVSVATDSQWQKLCEAMGRDDLHSRSDLRHLEGRRACEQEVDAAVSMWTSSRRAYEVTAILQSFKVPAGAVIGGAEQLTDPQLVSRGYWQWLERPWVGKRPHPGVLAKFSETPGEVRVPAPCFGQHTEEILSGLLGLSHDRIRKLEDDGVIGYKPAPGTWRLTNDG
jgi:crotonobetainyl-CoA:carnitine CoA-transferase CaiB-like acyl-CoA transferase